MNAKPLLLSAALSLALSTTFVARAQDTPTDQKLVAEATVPQSKLVDRYATAAGSTQAATDLIHALRTGTSFTASQQVTTTDATGKTTTSTVQSSVANPAKPMGYGEINITLAMAQALVKSGAYPSLQAALTGTTTTTTATNGTTTTTTSGGILAMRAKGAGWGQIAKSFGLNIGELVRSGNDKSAGTQHDHAHAGADHPAKPDHPVKPDKPDHPAKPDKPELPQKPERPGHP
ncbi:MAG: hypothetical protein HOQ02_06430 [Lysobacter sp.]|nr:hypothetical protein [Lysobacter sp.]